MSKKSQIIKVEGENYGTKKTGITKKIKVSNITMTGKNGTIDFGEQKFDSLLEFEQFVLDQQELIDSFDNPLQEEEKISFFTAFSWFIIVSLLFYFLFSSIG